MYRTTFFLLTLAFLGGGCQFENSENIPEKIQKKENLTVYPASSQPTHNIELTKDITYRDTSEVLFGPMIRGVEVDDEGKVYIFDFRQKKVHIFADDGTYWQSIGGEGRGPGEFILPWQIRVADNKLYILGYIQQKISVFDSQQITHVQDVPVEIGNRNGPKPEWQDWAQKQKFSYIPIDFFVQSDGNYLIFLGDENVGSGQNIADRTYEMSLFDGSEYQYLKHDLLSFDWTGQLMISKVDDKTSIIPDVPYKRSSQFDFSNGQLVQGWTDDFLFNFYDSQGRYQHAFYYPFEKIPLNEDAVLEHYRLSGSTEEVRNDTLPDTWPAFNSVVIDDQQRLWVSTFTEDPNIYEWLVLESSGKLLAKFKWPAHRELQEVQGDHVYTLGKDLETGLQNIVRYKIELNE